MKWTVHLRSEPGFYAQYEGTVSVHCTPDDDSDESAQQQVFRAAVRELARTSFPDRASLMFWRLVRVELTA